MKEKDYCLEGEQEVSSSLKGRRMQMNVLRTKQVSHVRKVFHAKFNQFQGRRSWGGCGGPDPPENMYVCFVCIVCNMYVCFDPPENVTFFHSKLLLYNCKFHNVKDEQLDTITSLILLMLTMLPSYF